jgi:hypothetical protein
MNINQDDEHDDEVGNGHDYNPAVEEIDLFGAAIALCQLAQRAKTIEGALKRLRKIGRDTLVAERNLAAVTAAAEQTNKALGEREAANAAREAANTKREAEFADAAQDVRDELREHHNRLEQTHRLLVYRLMSTAGILGDWHEGLQDLPSWEQLQRRIVDLPADPATSAAEVVSQNVRQDWTGHTFIAGSSLTRSVPQ